MACDELPDIASERIVPELAEPSRAMSHTGKPDRHIALCARHMLVKAVHILQGSHPVRRKLNHGFAKGNNLHLLPPHLLMIRCPLN
ncbi:hypothetical protein D3C71_1383450 [compost metagenome]